MGGVRGRGSGSRGRVRGGYKARVGGYKGKGRRGRGIVAVNPNP